MGLSILYKDLQIIRHENVGPCCFNLEFVLKFKNASVFRVHDDLHLLGLILNTDQLIAYRSYLRYASELSSLDN